MKAWSNTIKKMNYDCDIVFFGNSLTYYSDFSKDFSSKKIVNLGYPGQGLKGMLLRYNQISSVKPEKIFIMAGINDLGLDKMSFAEFSNCYGQLIDSIAVSNPHSEIFLESILPVNHSICAEHPKAINIIKANHFIRKYAKKKKLQYVDLYKAFADNNGELKKEYTNDGIHLKIKSYQVWTNVIRKYIE